MKKIIATLLTPLFFWCCTGSVRLATAGKADERPNPEILYVATIHPLAEIIKKVVGDRGRVETILSAAASPHTFSPTPVAAKKAETAQGLFYAGQGLDRQWALKMPARRHVEMLALLPVDFQVAAFDHDHIVEHNGQDEPAAGIDPHFWTDPLAVRAMLPRLVETLSSIDGAGTDVYKANGLLFAAELAELDRELSAALKPLQQQPLFLFHPSFQYFFKRYNLLLAGVIEPFAGREPTPKSLYRMVTAMKRLQIKAIFTEPQLPRRPVEVLAEAASDKAMTIAIYELDPLGGREGRLTLSQILRYNVAILLQALP